MTFRDDEESVEDSQPRDGYEFILPTVTYRLTSAVKDVVIAGQTYRAGTIQRGEIQVPTAAVDSPLTVSMLVGHALPQRYLRGGVPPRRIDVNVYRLQSRSGEAELAWSGRVTSMAVDRHIARFLIPARSREALQRRIPTITVGVDCPHVLYESGCNLDPTGHTATRTIVGVDGAKVTLSSAPDANNDWAKWGELVHTASGEGATIKSQIGAQLELQLPLDMKVGDSVEVRAGCAHDIATCRTKFANHVNYGGVPDLPRTNPFVPNGYGLYRRD